MIKNCDESVEINHNRNCAYIPDHPYNLKIQKHSLIIQKQLMMFMKIWKTVIKQRKGEC